MIVAFNNKSYILDLDEMNVEEARIIKKYAALTLKGLQDGLAELDPDAMTCLYWLMLRQAGEDHSIERVTFKILKFAEAVGEAQEAEANKLIEEAARRALDRDAAVPKDVEPDEA